MNQDFDAFVRWLNHCNYLKSLSYIHYVGPSRGGSSPATDQSYLPCGSFGPRFTYRSGISLLIRRNLCRLLKPIIGLHLPCKERGCRGKQRRAMLDDITEWLGRSYDKNETVWKKKRQLAKPPGKAVSRIVEAAVHPHGLYVGTDRNSLFSYIKDFREANLCGVLPPVRLRSSEAPLHLGRWWTVDSFMEQKYWGGGVERTARPSLVQAPGCLHQDLRCRDTVKASTNEPMYVNDSSFERRRSYRALPSGPLYTLGTPDWKRSVRIGAALFII